MLSPQLVAQPNPSHPTPCRQDTIQQQQQQEEEKKQQPTTTERQTEQAMVQECWRRTEQGRKGRRKIQRKIQKFQKCVRFVQEYIPENWFIWS